MKIAFLADPLSGFKIYKDSTFAMMREAARRGHQIYAFEQRHMVLEQGVVTADVVEITLTGDPDDWYRAGEAQTLAPVRVRRRHPAQGPAVRHGICLRHLSAGTGRAPGRARVQQALGDPRPQRKAGIGQFSEFTSPTLVTSSGTRLRAFHAEHGDVILKPLDGMGGAGIFRVKDDGLNLGSIIETLTDNGARTIMAQKYIPAIVKGDKRVLVIDGKPVPFVLARIPQGGEVRGNLAAGGVGVAQPISEREREIAEALGPTLAERGLLLVGLDVIGDFLTEVNVTSPTCFQEISDQTGLRRGGDVHRRRRARS
jgi:glutathione synthase